MTDAPTAPAQSGVATRDARAYLARIRAPHRSRQRRDAALLLYGCVLAAAVWVVPYLLRTAQAAQAGDWRGGFADVLPTALPAVGATVHVLVVTAMAQSALWRGPVRVEPPTAAWILASPVLRGPLLGPAFRAAALRVSALGAVLGGVAGFLLHAFTPAPWPAPTAAGACAGLLTALTGAAVGVLVERHEDVVVARPWILRAGWGCVVVLGAVAALSLSGRTPARPVTVLLRSGPWGWSTQPLLAALGAPAPWWPLALSAATCTTAALAATAIRSVGRIPARALRRRATAVARATASLATLELRQARAAVSTAGSAPRGSSRPALRLALPRHRLLLVPWRDATCLLRAPGRLAWSALWAAAAAVLAAVSPSVPAAVCTVTAAYLAAAQLTEPARLENDDPRRRANLPHGPGRLALAHAAVPAALLTTGLALAAAVAAANGTVAYAHLVLVLAAPALVSTALVSAYRGSIPPHLLVGTETPLGNTGPFQVLLWYLRGPLAALALLTPALLVTPGLVPSLWTLLAGACCLAWARRAGLGEHRDSRRRRD